MNIARINFHELYERHLCRHSEYGNNVIHLATVFVSYFGLFGLAFEVVNALGTVDVVSASATVAAFVVPYVVLLACNVPWRVLAACLVFMAAFFAVFLSLPLLPLWLCWVYPLLVILAHRVQNWSHKIYRRERDMTEFNKKYKKGPVLFLMLSLYELPILLNYLVFDRKSWTQTEPVPAAATVSVGAD